MQEARISIRRERLSTKKVFVRLCDEMLGSLEVLRKEASFSPSRFRSTAITILASVEEMMAEASHWKCKYQPIDEEKNTFSI